MNLHGATILILGGSGLVGRAVGRRLLACATWILRHEDAGERIKR